MGWNLTELVARHQVPGAQVAVLANDEIEEHSAGVLNLRTGVETTPDSVFQIGSITKIWTSTLAQQLVNEGVLNLDCPIRSYLPDFALSDPSAAESVTARHLLTHTNGIDGNLFTDTGISDDAVAKFVATLRTADQLFPPGTMFSYSNTGFAVLGHLVEVLRGKPFHDVLREELITPLGLKTVSTNAYEAILHLTGFAELREPQVTVPPNVGAPQWGLGWMLHGDGVVGHTGTTIGQKAFLRVVPSKGVAVAVLTNGLGGAPLAHEVITHTLRDLAGVDTPPRPTPPADPAPVEDWMCGTYRGTKVDYVLSREGDRAFLDYLSRDGEEVHDRMEIVRLDDHSIITLEPEFGTHYVGTFVGRDDEGHAKFLHNVNALPRIA